MLWPIAKTHLSNEVDVFKKMELYYLILDQRETITT